MKYSTFSVMKYNFGTCVETIDFSLHNFIFCNTIGYDILQLHLLDTDQAFKTAILNALFYTQRSNEKSKFYGSNCPAFFGRNVVTFNFVKSNKSAPSLS